MNINTTRFGEIEINDNLIFNFVEPILGYEQLSKFTLIDHQPESPFKWLQSMEDGSIAFPVTIPALFGMDYQFTIPEEEAKLLGLTEVESLLILNIVNIPSGQPQDATINLLGPVIFNTDNNKAMQLVLINSDYPVRKRLFSETIKEKLDNKVENKS